MIKRPMCVPKLKVSSWRTRLCAFLCACFSCKSGHFETDAKCGSFLSVFTMGSVRGAEVTKPLLELQK